VRAEFRLADSQIEDIREKLKTLPKYEPVFLVEVKDEARVVIAEVEKRCTYQRNNCSLERQSLA
jgi:hypothetical protein